LTLDPLVLGMMFTHVSLAPLASGHLWRDWSSLLIRRMVSSLLAGIPSLLVVK
jgi:hypothetical protein